MGNWDSHYVSSGATQVATVYSGVGVPPASLGQDGDAYIRKDGTTGACLYHKRSGSWVATAA